MRAASRWFVVAGVVVACAAIAAVRGCGTRDPVGPEPDGASASPAAPLESSPAARASSTGDTDPRGTGAHSRPRSRQAAPSAAPPAADTPDPAAGGTAMPASGDATRDRPRPATPDRREGVPEGAVAVDLAEGTRAWLVSDRTPRGLAGEPAAVPGRVQVHLSQPAKTALVFRVEADPPDAVKLLGREPLVRIAAGRDIGSVGFAGLRSGTVSIVLRLIEGADAGAAPALRTSVEVRAHDEFPDPVVVVTTEAPGGADASGSLVTGERRMAGLRGAVCGVLRIRRSGFRDFATAPTSVDIAVDDPTRILEPLPATVTIAAGASEPSEPIPVRLRDAEGRATLRVRAAGVETAIPVESVTARWQGPTTAVLPLASLGRVRLRCAPGTEEAPRWGVSVLDTSVLGAEAAPGSAAPTEEGVVLSLQPRAPGETTVRVVAPHRPEFELRATVVAPEATVRAGRPVLLGLAAGAKGTVVLTVAASARFDDVAGATLPQGMRVAITKGRTVTVTIDDPLAAAGDLTLPVCLTGAGAGVRVRVVDRVRAPLRAEYEIDAGP